MGDIIIDLTNELDTDLDTDDSFDWSQETLVLDNNLAASDQSSETETPSSTLSQDQFTALSHRRPIDFGDCAICWDQIGLNFLASTKCGHVFCFQCLERELQNDKLCPTCMCPIVGNSDYHPLYLRNILV